MKDATFPHSARARRFRGAFVALALAVLPPAAVFAAVPGAPANVALDGDSTTPAAGKGQIKVTWDAPADDGGAEITGYKARWAAMGAATYLNDGGADGADASNVGARSHLIENLATGVEYRVQVAAVNADGAGAWSAAKSVAPATKPGKPELHTLVAARGGITATWSPPEETGGAPLTGYRLRWSLNKTGALWNGENEEGIEFPADTTTHTITGLPNETHKVQVAALNRVGISRWVERTKTPKPNLLPDYSAASPLALTFPVNQPIDPPHALPASGGDAPLVFSFGADSGGVLDLPPGMTLQTIPPSGDDTARAGIGGTPNTLGTTQTLLVATDADGESATLRINIVIAPAPSAPQNVGIAVSASATNVSWQPPASDGGGEITNYRVRWRPASSPGAWANPGGAAGSEVAAAARAFNIGATAGIAHEVQVAAVADGVHLGIWSQTPFHRYTLLRAVRDYTIGVAVNDPLHGYYAGADAITYTFTRLFPPGAPAGLPGLTFDAAANAIAGTPTEVTAPADLHFFRHAAATAGASAGENIRLRVLGGVSFGAARIADQTYHQGVPIRPMILPAGSGASGLQYALTPALPPGLTFDAATRALSGTPTAAALYQEFTYAVTAANRSSAALRFGIIVQSALPFESPPDARIRVNAGAAVSLSLPMVIAAAGDAPFAYSLDGELPPGLIFDAVLRRISGTPSAVAPKRALIWRVRDSSGGSGAWHFEMEVADGIYFAAGAADREYMVGEAVTLALPAVLGGSGNVSTEVSGLPAGLAFADGSISGMPGEVGHSKITYTATDATRGEKISLEFRINVVSSGSAGLFIELVPFNGIGGRISLGPLTVARPNEETRFEWVDTGGADDARLGTDYTATPSGFEIVCCDIEGKPVVAPEYTAISTREPADRHIEPRTRSARLSTVAVSGDTGKYKNTEISFTIADIDSDTAKLRLTLLDAASGAAAGTLAANTPRRVKIRAELIKPAIPLGPPGSGIGGTVEQPLTASQAIDISFTYPDELGAPPDAPAQLRLGAGRESAETGAFALTPSADGAFTVSAVFTPDLGALQSPADVDAPSVAVTSRPLAIGDDRAISEDGDVLQQSIAGTMEPGARVAVSARIAADDAPGANSASPADFRTGGEIASAFPLDFAVGDYDGNEVFYAVIPLRGDDQLIEGDESFTLSLLAPGSATARATITIDADGAAQLDVSAPQTADGADVVFTGSLALQRNNDRGIAVGAGGSLTYSNANTPPQMLVFADADRDGVLAGAELRAVSDAWAVEANARAQVFKLQNAAALPAGLRAAQFLPAGGAPVQVPAPPVVALNQVSITLAENADSAAATLSVTITPPLPAAGELLLSYTTDTAGADDYTAATALSLPAGAGAVRLPASIRDDLVTESQEQFAITISAPPGADYVIDPQRSSAQVRIADNDIAGVIFRGESQSNAPIADAGAEVALSARITGAVQVGANAELVIADPASTVQLRFADANGDGVLLANVDLGDIDNPLDDRLLHNEITADFTWLAPLGDFDTTTFHFALQPGAPRGLTAAAFDIGELTVQKSAGNGVLQIQNVGAARAENAGAAYSLPVRLSSDADQAFGVEVIASFADGAPKTLSKTIAFTAADDARIAKTAEFTPADFAMLGLADNLALDAERAVMFTAQLDADTLARGATQMRAAHALAIEDDERNAQVRYRLVDADGAPLAQLRTGSPSIAFLSVELLHPARAISDGDMTMTLAEMPVTLGIPELALTPRLADGGLSAAELGLAGLPALRILFGESRALSERLLITPSRNGNIPFATAAIQPPLLALDNVAADAPHSASNDAPDRSAQVDLARNIVLEELSADDALLDEGASGVMLGFRIETLQGAAATLQVNGADVEAVLTYAVTAGEIALLSAQDDDLADLPGESASFAAATVTIPAGASSGVIPVPDIVDDALEEPSEIFAVMLTGISAATGAEIAGAAIPSERAIARYAIARSDTPAGKLLSMAVIGAPSEADGAATITLTRPPGSSVEISGFLLPSEASADSADYDGASRAFTIPAGMPSVEIRLPLVDDAVIEGDEEFRVSALVIAPQDGSVLTPSRALSVPVADDDIGSIEFAETSLRVFEGGTLTVRVVLSADAKRDVRFTVTPVFGDGGNAASAADFLVPVPAENRNAPASSADELTVSDAIAAGARAAAFGYLIAHDTDPEETFELRLSFTDPADGSAHDGRIELGAIAATVTLRPAVFDVDNSAASDATDGLLIARYLLGLRGAALIAGLENDLAQGADADSIAAAIAAAKEQGALDVDGEGGVTAADGIMIARYFLGVTGDALTKGQSAVDADTVAKNIADLLPQP